MLGKHESNEMSGPSVVEPTSISEREAVLLKFIYRLETIMMDAYIKLDPISNVPLCVRA